MEFYDAGRLEDKSALVRKQALILLTALLGFNPFAPQLPEDKFAATLEEYRRQLKVLLRCRALFPRFERHIDQG